jgi:DNA-binding response OmpR family regulator
MRGVNDGAAETESKIRGVLVLSGPLDEADGIRKWAEERGVVILRDGEELDLDTIEAALVQRVRDRSKGLEPEALLRVGPLRVRPSAGDVTLNGAPFALRKTERDVLVYLMQNAHRFVTAHELQERVLKTHGDGGAARNQVYELRRKLRASGHADAIETRPQQGYRLSWTP